MFKEQNRTDILFLRIQALQHVSHPYNHIQTKICQRSMFKVTDLHIHCICKWKYNQCNAEGNLLQ